VPAPFLKMMAIFLILSDDGVARPKYWRKPPVMVKDHLLFPNETALYKGSVVPHVVFTYFQSFSLVLKLVITPI
jgi:hypothetical protein